MKARPRQDVRTTAILLATDRTHPCSRVDGHDAVGGGVQVTQVVARICVRFAPGMEQYLRRMRDLERRLNPSQSLAMHISPSARNQPIRSNTCTSYLIIAAANRVPSRQAPVPGKVRPRQPRHLGIGKCTSGRGEEELLDVWEMTKVGWMRWIEVHYRSAMQAEA